MWNNTDKNKKKKKKGAIPFAVPLVAMLLCGSVLLNPSAVLADDTAAVPKADLVGADSMADASGTSFTFAEDINTAGRKGLWKDIAPEGSVKGTSSYQIRVLWNQNVDREQRTLSWKSSDPAIASVNGNGLVTGHREGHVDVTASNGSESRKFSINVKIPSDEPYTIENGVLSYTSPNLGKKYHLGINVTDGNVTWQGVVSSSAQNVLAIQNGAGGEDLYLTGGKACAFRTVTKEGRTSVFTLTPAEAGTAQARADGADMVNVVLNAPATLSVSTTQTVLATGVKAPDDFVMKVGETVTLSSKVTPDNATVVPGWDYREVTDYWKNYTRGMPEFSGAIRFDGTNVTGLKPGTATLVVSAPSGVGKTVSDTLRITVVDQNTRLFDDVRKVKSYYYEPVYWALQDGIANGTSENLFSPGQTVTRGQIAMMLWKAEGSPEPKTDPDNESLENPFTDVQKSSPFYKAILWAYQNGITTGVGTTEFGPNLPCTRAQIVTFLYNYEGSPKIDRTKQTQKFSDVSEKNFYYNAVYYAVTNGITSGVSEEQFGPDQTCTRGQAVTFLYRAQKTGK